MKQFCKEKLRISYKENTDCIPKNLWMKIYLLILPNPTYWHPKEDLKKLIIN